MDVHNNKHKIKLELRKLLFVTIIMLFPFPIFIIILYSEPVIKDFFQITSSQIAAIPHMKYEVPNLYNKTWLFFSVWFSVSAILFSLFILIVFIYKFDVLNNTKKYFFFNISLMLSTLVIIILSIIILTLSEIKYYYINMWCKDIKLYYNPSEPLSKDYVLIDSILQNIQKHDASMDWLNYNNALWFGGIEISIICFNFIYFQLKLFSNTNDARIIYQINQNYKREFFGESKEKQFLSKFLKPTPKNISIFLIIFSLIVLTPCLIYLLKISFFNNSFNTLIELTYFEPTMPKLSQEFNTNSYYIFFDDVISTLNFSKYYYITWTLYLPEILLILSISFTITFIFFVINEHILSINFLTSLIIILWFIIIATVIMIFYSSYTLNYFSEEWSHTISSDSIKYGNLQDYLVNKSNVWEGDHLNKCWLNRNESISLLILQMSLFTSISIIGISQIFKTINQKNVIKTVPI